MFIILLYNYECCGWVFSLNLCQTYISQHLLFLVSCDRPISIVLNVKSALQQLVFTRDGVGVGVVFRVIRELMTQIIEYRSCQGSHKLDGIGVRRINMFPFLLILFTALDLSLMIQRKLGCRGQKQKWKNQPMARPGMEHCNWFILLLLLVTQTMQF